MTLILNEQITRANVPIPDQQVSEIIKATPKGEVTGRLAGQIREAIRRNRAAKVGASGTTK